MIIFYCNRVFCLGTCEYSLAGASKPQLAAFTVAALKSHLKHFKLPTTGTISCTLTFTLWRRQVPITCMLLTLVTHKPMFLHKEMATVACTSTLATLKEMFLHKEVELVACKLTTPAPCKGICPHKEILLTSHCYPYPNLKPKCTTTAIP